jgi:hypothetical protein
MYNVPLRLELRAAGMRGQSIVHYFARIRYTRRSSAGVAV